MNHYLAAAAALAIVVGIVHSVMGEVLIFRRMRVAGGVVPTNGGRVIGEGHVRILWASWHALTALGCCIGAVLLSLSTTPLPAPAQAPVLHAIVAAMAVGALLVLVGTRARHPGWAGLLGVAALTWLGSGA